MNLGRDTIDELFFAVEKDFTNAELQRLLIRYRLTGWETETTTPKMIVKALPSVHNTVNGTIEMSNMCNTYCRPLTTNETAHTMILKPYRSYTLRCITPFYGMDTIPITSS
jgi:hypothetical protein